MLFAALIGGRLPGESDRALRIAAHWGWRRWRREWRR
jgi:hypothetical protein